MKTNQRSFNIRCAALAKATGRAIQELVALGEDEVGIQFYDSDLAWVHQHGLTDLEYIKSMETL